MEFKEAHEAMKNEKFIRPASNYSWRKIDINDCWLDENEKLTSVSWPIRVYTWDTWEIKPEEIFIWGVCSHDGVSHLSSEKPRNAGTILEWISNYPKTPFKNNMFPNGDPQKYILVPVDD